MQEQTGFGRIMKQFFVASILTRKSFLLKVKNVLVGIKPVFFHQIQCRYVRKFQGDFILCGNSLRNDFATSTKYSVNTASANQNCCAENSTVTATTVIVATIRIVVTIGIVTTTILVC